MILQHGEPLLVWGGYRPRAELVVSFMGASYGATADEAGNWAVEMASAPPGGPFTMTIAGLDGADRRVIEDVYLGDLWLCSGQSNMELSMRRLKDDYPDEFALPSFPCIRQFTMSYTWDFSKPRETVPAGRWAKASAESLADFSGTGWFFARYWQDSRSIPVGLVLAAAGGAPIESFMSKDALRDFPQKIARGERFADPAFLAESVRKGDEAVRGWDDAVSRADLGIALGWFMPGTDDSLWKEISLPGRFDSLGELSGFCGSLWLRRTFYLPEGMSGKDLKLWMGTIVDSDTAYINGEAVGSTGYCYPPRKYLIPSRLLKAGVNQITLRVVCNGGEGGVTYGKPFAIFAGADPKEGLPIRLSGLWRYKVGTKVSLRPRDLFIQWEPMGLFNGMIAPLVRLAIRGVLWYQGETDAGRHDEYARLFPAMIRDWREKFRRGDLPFLFVQLPLFGPPEDNREASSWAQLRDVQRRALAIPATGMAAALDLGEWNDLHPVNKRDIGFRLAIAAESVLRRKDLDSPGPLLSAAERRGDSLTLRFLNCGTGLEARGSPPAEDGEARAYVSVVNGKGEPIRVPARIGRPDRLEVDLAGIEDPRRVLYAWADNPVDRQLYNHGGLPAIPFRIDIPDSIGKEIAK